MDLLKKVQKEKIEEEKETVSFRISKRIMDELRKRVPKSLRSEIVERLIKSVIEGDSNGK